MIGIPKKLYVLIQIWMAAENPSQERIMQSRVHFWGGILSDENLYSQNILEEDKRATTNVQMVWFFLFFSLLYKSLNFKRSPGGSNLKKFEKCGKV